MPNRKRKHNSEIEASVLSSASNIHTILFNPDIEEVKKIDHLETLFNVAKEYDNYKPLNEEEVCLHARVCAILEKQYIMHKILLDDKVPISVLQCLINNDVAIDNADKQGFTPFRKALDVPVDDLSSMQKSKLFLYYYNLRLIYALEPNAWDFKKNQLSLSKTIGLSSSSAYSKENFNKFILNIESQTNQFLAAPEFTKKILQTQIKQANNHGIFDDNKINEVLTVFIENGKKNVIDKWMENLNNVRDVFNLEKFYSREKDKLLTMESDRMLPPKKRRYAREEMPYTKMCDPQLSNITTNIVRK